MERAKDRSAQKQKKICRTEDVTGSLIAKRRVCLTKGEWDDLAANARKGMDDYTGLNAHGAPACISGIDITCQPDAGPR